MSGHGHHGDPHLAHHFETREQQFSSAKLGMWLFLAQEILFFGGLFCAYSIWRALSPELFKYGASMLDWKLGALNTVVLLVSSFTMAMAVRTSMLRQKNATQMYLALTLICAGGFMVVKYVEYSHKFHMGTVMTGVIDEKTGERKFLWSKGFDYSVFIKHDHEQAAAREKRVARHFEEPPAPPPPSVAPEDRTAQPGAAQPPVGLAPQMLPSAHASTDGHGDSSGAEKSQAAKVGHGDDHHHFDLPEETEQMDRPEDLHMFFGIYFCLTGLHGIHVLAGMIMLIWLMWGVHKGRHVDGHFTAIDCGGLYWHLVDLVWIFLFPLLYLI